MPWRRKWQPTPISLLGESHGQRSLAGYSPWGCKESDVTERLSNNRARYASLYYIFVDPSLSLKSPHFCLQMGRSKKTMVNQCHHLSSTDPLVKGVIKCIFSYLYHIYTYKHLVHISYVYIYMCIYIYIYIYNHMQRGGYIYIYRTCIYLKWFSKKKKRFSKDTDGQHEFPPAPVLSSQESIEVLVSLANAACSFIKVVEVRYWGVLSIERVPHWLFKFWWWFRNPFCICASFGAIFNHF